MADIRIQDLFLPPLEGPGGEKRLRETPLTDFKTVIADSVGHVNQQLLRADEEAREMVLGKKDIHQAMISIEEAHLSMRLLIQVRNKIISAYEEVMRMQF